MQKLLEKKSMDLQVLLTATDWNLEYK